MTEATPEEKKAKENTTMLIWAKHPTCHHCGDDLVILSARVEDFPYLHCDINMKCLICGEIYVHGLPKLHDTGVALHAMDSNLKDAIAYMDGLGEKKCRQCKIPMLMTKLWGDWIFKETDVVHYQWKCPHCYLVHHEIHHRTFPHGDGQELTDEEAASVIEKLKRMGYM